MQNYNANLSGRRICLDRQYFPDVKGTLTGTHIQQDDGFGGWVEYILDTPQYPKDTCIRMSRPNCLHFIDE